jgi:hypothetical protein
MAFHPAAGQVLEHIAEARRLPYVPLMVLVPGEAALRHLVTTQASSFFDVVSVLNRKKGGLAPALKALRDAVNDQNSARFLLELLRRPFKADRSANDRLALADARKLAASLGEKPGKRYWGFSELIPHLLAGKLQKEAEEVLQSLEKDPACGFNTLLMRHIVLAATDRPGAARSLVVEALRWPNLTRNRMEWLGEMLDRWKAMDALADLLDGWHARAALADSHKMLYLAAKYCRQAGQLEAEGAYLMGAVLQDPLRHEYLTALAAHLGDTALHDRAVDICRLAIQAGVDTAALRVRLVSSLREGRRMREARLEMGLCLERFPDDKAVLELRRKFS